MHNRKRKADPAPATPKHTTGNISACYTGLPPQLDPPEKWLAASLMLQPFNTAPHAVVTSKHRIIFVAIS